MNQPEAMISLYADAITLARSNAQTVGEKNDYYVTLEQLEALMKPFIQINFT